MTSARLRLPVIQTLWIGGRLSTMEQLSLASFVAHGHDVHLYTYDGVEGVPEGVVLRDGREIIGADRIFKYKKEGSYAGFSNVFRYKLLLDKGNFWVDSDVVCLRPFDFDEPYVFSGARSGGEQHYVQSCVIGTPAGAEVMRYCYDTSSARRTDELVWGEIGPDLLRSAVYRHDLSRYILLHAFTRVDWRRAGCFISGSPFVVWRELLKEKFHRARASHLYNEIWRQSGWDKNGDFPPNSLYERWKRTYLKTGRRG
jgi:hypothetical protein